MSDDFPTAYERALELVGEGVWTKLSAITQATIINEELRLLNAERVAREAAHDDQSRTRGQPEPPDKRGFRSARMSEYQRR